MTRTKLDKLDRLTARITNGIRLTSSFISNETELDRKTVRKMVKDNEIANRTGLSAGFVDQIVDKVIWSWRSYKKLHKDWERRVDEAQERVDLAEDDDEDSGSILNAAWAIDNINGSRNVGIEPPAKVILRGSSMHFSFGTYPEQSKRIYWL